MIFINFCIHFFLLILLYLLELSFSVIVYGFVIVIDNTIQYISGRQVLLKMYV